MQPKPDKKQPFSKESLEMFLPSEVQESNRLQIEARKTATVEADHLTDESDVDDCSNEEEGWSLSDE